MLPSDDHGSYAVIDLVAHLYRGGAEDRRVLAGIWNRYSEATESERKSKGFELVRMHHATLTRMFRDGACARACVRVGWIWSRRCLSEPNANAQTNERKGERLT
jgi:hypothetical protein